MPQFIIHHEGAYNIYGTIADGCHYESALTLDQLRQVIQQRFGEDGMSKLPERLERAHAKGCSGYEWTLDDCIEANRQGPKETRLPREVFIERFLTLPVGGSSNG